MDTTLSIELLKFRDFCTHEGHNIVTSITRANMHSLDLQQPEQVEDFTRHVFQGAMEQLLLQWQTRRSLSEPTVVNQPTLPPTPPSTFTQDMNDMGINDTFTMNDDDDDPLLPMSQQFDGLDIPWTNNQVEQDTAAQQQWMYFGEPMNQGQQFWNDHRVLDGMGGWSR